MKNIIDENWNKYRIPSGANYQKRSKNAVYISPGNTVRHELAKCIGSYMIRKYGDLKFSKMTIFLLKELEKTINDDMKDFSKQKSTFITEAVPKKEPERRVDLVRLEDDFRIEFETNKKILKKDCLTIYI